ncbi:Peptidase S24-like [Pseudomonas flavescens]|uniref:Peptidase S24-like n=1 Tax=Phytopseudomonas flavescens TaxID=29435 RepID=A0A1G8NBG6_9GAMM|nr:LexA family transcriptional regulator [Pseudomonas flavescens]SDI77436.1 Peptidase S24-like [Pseudomonas flavescens]
MNTQAERQKVIAGLFTKRRNELKLSQGEVASRVRALLGGVAFTQQSYAAIESGKTKHSKYLTQIARVLGIPPQAIDPVGLGPDTAQETPPHYASAVVVGTAERKLPVIGSVAAGTWCEAVDNFQPGDAEEWIDAPGPVGPNAFVLRIEGFSMHSPTDPISFNDGDKVVIDPSREATPGDFVVAKLTSSNSVTFKRLRQEDGMWFLEALNPDWKPRYIQVTEEWQICGRGMWKVQQL